MIIAWVVGWESDFRENQERKEPRKFKKGDRVRVNDSWDWVDVYLQKDNRVGVIVCYSRKCNGFLLQMDKPVIIDSRGTDSEMVPQGYAFFTNGSRLELIGPASKPQKPFDIEEWRKNLKPGDKVRVVEDPVREFKDNKGVIFVKHRTTENMSGWIGRRVTLAKKDFISGIWEIKEDSGRWAWHWRWFEPVDKSKLSQPSELREIEEKKESPDPRLKTLIQTAQELIQDIEKAFKDSHKYPIFGINLAKQEPVEKTKKDDLDESLLSLGVVLYHLYTGQSEHNNHSYLLDGYPKPEDMPGTFWVVVDKLINDEYGDLQELKEDLKNFKDGGQK